MVRRSCALLTAAMLVLFATHVETQATNPPWRVIENFGSGPGVFGGSVDIDGDSMVVGSPSANTPGDPQTGSLRTYRRSNARWALEWELPATDNEPARVALDGDTLAVGGTMLDIYQRSNGTWTRVFRTSIGGTAQLAMSGNTVVVVNESGGQVYVRNAGAWTFEKVLPCEDFAKVAIDGDTVVFTKTFGVDIYTRVNGVWGSAKSPSVGGSSYLTSDVAIRGNRIVLASTRATAYVLEQTNGTWGRTAELSLLTTAMPARVAIDDHEIVLAQQQDCFDIAGYSPCELPYTIAAYNPTPSGWTKAATRTTSGTYGSISQIALDNGQLVIGLGITYPYYQDGVHVYANMAADAADVDVASNPYGEATFTLTGQLINADAVSPQWTFNGVVKTGVTATFTAPIGEWTATFSDSTYAVSTENAVRVHLPNSTGPAGAVGGTGATGYTGGTGAKGATGATGANPIGLPGATGATGASPTGAVGRSGNTGATGATGSTGALGAAGALGPQGISGSNGQSGNQGATGPQGPAGAIGIAGAIGPAGLPGATGTRGEKGDIGDPGSRGVDGARGIDGSSGAVGGAGATGARGDQGDRGDAGDQGASGATGAIGANGIEGAAGAKGAEGATGSAGSTGATGAAGSMGDTGATGSTGATGPTGSTGAFGSAGPTGIAGDIGDRGPLGSVGVKGPLGDQGTAGSIGPSGPGEPPDLHSIVFMLDGDQPPAGYVMVGAFWEERVDADGAGGRRPRRLRIVMWQK